MYNTVIGVGAAVLVGGVALYTGYQMTRGDADADAERSEIAADRAVAETARTAEGRTREANRGRGGVPSGERALDFAEGAAGDRVRPEGAEAERAAAEIAARAEDERLAALGEGGVLDAAGAQDAAEGAAASVRRDADLLADRTGDAMRDVGDRAAATADAAQDRGATVAESARGGLRGALTAQDDGDDADRTAARTGAATTPRTVTTGEDEDLAITARGSDAPDERLGAEGTGASAIAAGAAGSEATPDRTGGGAPGLRTAANRTQIDKPDTARNRPMVDKPDTQLARLVDKPDNSPSFAASDPGRTFDPCTKADGTPYAGPGTAINPFADGDPCLPKATGQSFEVAALAPPRAPLTASSVGQSTPRILPFVDLVRPGFVVAPPVGGNFGSDYGN